MTAARLIALATLVVPTFTMAALGGPHVDVEIDLPADAQSSPILKLCRSIRSALHSKNYADRIPPECPYPGSPQF